MAVVYVDDSKHYPRDEQQKGVLRDADNISVQRTSDIAISTGTPRRAAKKCPVPDCGVQVIHLPRHLRDKHGWNAEEARGAVQRYRLRKQCTFSTNKCPKYRDYHKSRKCPIENCSAVVSD